MSVDRTGLSQLVGDPGSFREHHWGALPFEYRSDLFQEMNLEEVIWDEIDCGFLAKPFVALSPDVPDAWVTRIVQNTPCEGYLHPDHARVALKSGSAMIFPQSELWSVDVAHLLDEIREDFAFSVSATFVAVPAGSKDFDLGHVSGIGASEHVFALTTDASLRLSITPPKHVQMRDEALSGTGESGTVYYVPPGWSLRMDQDAPSAVLVIRLSEPTPQQCAEIGLAMFLSQIDDDIAGSHHRMTADEKLNWLRTSLPDFFSGLSTREILAHLASS